MRYSPSSFADDLNAMSHPDHPEPDYVVQLPSHDKADLSIGIFNPSTAATTDVVVLLHGAGVNMRLGYGGLADTLRHLGALCVVTPDMRGHGESSGRRGYARSPGVLWRDIDIVLDWIQGQKPGARIHLCGHSSGAGLALNWRTRHRARAVDIASLTLIAPFLYTKRTVVPSGQDRLQSTQRIRFANARPWVFAIYLVTRGWFGSTWTAVRFSFPRKFVRKLGLVSGYSAAVAIAVSPQDAEKQLGELDIPTMILAASDDQLFSADRLEQLIQRLHNSKVGFQRVSGGHMSCLRGCVEEVMEVVATS